MQQAPTSRTEIRAWDLIRVEAGEWGVQGCDISLFMYSIPQRQHLGPCGGGPHFVLSTEPAAGSFLPASPLHQPFHCKWMLGDSMVCTAILMIDLVSADSAAADGPLIVVLASLQAVRWLLVSEPGQYQVVRATCIMGQPSKLQVMFTSYFLDLFPACAESVMVRTCG